MKLPKDNYKKNLMPNQFWYNDQSLNYLVFDFKMFDLNNSISYGLYIR